MADPQRTPSDDHESPRVPSPAVPHDRFATESAAEQGERDAREADAPPDFLANPQVAKRGNTGDPQVPRTPDKREDVAKAQNMAGGTEPREAKP